MKKEGLAGPPNSALCDEKFDFTNEVPGNLI